MVIRQKKWIQNMNLFLFILVALAVILEAHICLAGKLTYCGKPYDNSREKDTSSAKSQCGCCKPSNKKPVQSCRPTLPKGTLYYYNKDNEFLYCSICQPYHLKSSMEDLSLWFHNFIACLTWGAYSYENGVRRPCDCLCHTF